MAELQEKCPGRNKKERAQALWKEIQSLYESNGVPACRRLKKLNAKGVQKLGKTAVLDAKAADVRHFCTDILELLAKSESFNSKQLVKSGEKLISQYMVLEQEALHVDPEDTLTWRAKPKLHLMKPERAAAPKTVGPTGTTLKAFSFRSFFTNEEGSPSLVTRAPEVGS